MAWTTPKTWASEPLTSLDLNTYVRDNQNYLKGRVDATAKQYVRTATNYTTTSTTLVDVDATNLAHTITTDGEDVLVTLAGYANINSTGGRMTLAVDIDGTPYTILYLRSTASGADFNVSFSYLFTGLTAASHTFKLQWKMSSDTGTLYAGALLFDVREAPGVVA